MIMKSWQEQDSGLSIWLTSAEFIHEFFGHTIIGGHDFDGDRCFIAAVQ